MPKKKVIVVSPGLYPCAIGGAEVFNYNLIKGLRDRFDVDFVTACNSEIEGARLVRIPFKRVFFQQVYVFLRLLFSPRNSLLIVSFMDTKWRYIIGYPLLNIFLGKRYVLICHSGGVPVWEWGYPYRLLFSRSEIAFGVSAGICDEYRKRTGVNVEFLPPLIPFEKSSHDKFSLRERYSIKSDANVFLAVGSLKDIKRPMVVLSAIRSLGIEYLQSKKIKMVFAGNGMLLGEMRDYIAKHNLDDFVLLLGNIPREELHHIYAMSDTFIMASDFEGMPIAMLEAIHNGMLVLGSDAVGIRDIINGAKCGFLFDNTKPDQLSDLIRLSCDNSFSEKRSAAEVYFSSNYCYQDYISKVSSRFDAL